MSSRGLGVGICLSKTNKYGLYAKNFLKSTGAFRKIPIRNKFASGLFYPVFSPSYRGYVQYGIESYIVFSSLIGNVEKAEPWWKQDAELWKEVESPDEFKSEVVSPLHELVVVDWFATWCHGCRKTSTHLSRLASDITLRSRVKFVRACVDQMANFAKKEGATSLPYMGIYDPKGNLLIGFGIPASKHKSFKINILTILDNPGKEYRLDPLGFIIPINSLDKVKIENGKEKALSEMQIFRTSISNKLSESIISIKKNNNNQNVKMNDLPLTSNIVNERELTEFEKEKACFLEKYKSSYGYNGIIDTIYQSEIGCRMKSNEHYMDYTGSSLYSQSQIENIFNDLKVNIFGNPHSMNPSSSLTQERLDEVREMILKFFNADSREYQVIFTKSATSALKMIGETFPWSNNGIFMYLRENHNSVLGIREYVLKNQSCFKSVSETFVEDWLSGKEELDEYNEEASGPVFNLFAYPAEDNFAGVKYPLRWIKDIKEKSKPGSYWYVLLDAAAYVPTQPLDLSSLPVDFVTLSFYKMFGYPTGLGALIARIDAVDILNKVFWAGGSVALSTSKDNFHVMKCRPSDRLEDGTVAFLDIISLKHGFKMIENLGGISKIQNHVWSLTEWIYEKLSSLKHSNGSNIVKIFGKHQYPKSKEIQGGIINFGILSPSGMPLSYKSFEKEAASAGFHIRTGSECNPGAAYHYLQIYESEIEELAGKKEGCEDDMEFIEVQRSEKDYNFDSSVSGSSYNSIKLTDNDINSSQNLEMLEWIRVPLGSVRASLGYMSTFEDCYEFSKFVENNYKDRTS